MSNLKRYIVEDPFKEYSVSLEVDHDILTVDLAVQINGFWSGADHRLAEQDGDVEQTVIRLFGARLMALMLEEGGAEFSVRNPSAGAYWGEKLRQLEGWGGETGSQFGWCGIRVAAADVTPSDYDSVELRVVPEVDDD